MPEKTRSEAGEEVEALRRLADTPDGSKVIRLLKRKAALKASPYSKNQSVEETHVRIGRQQIVLEILSLLEKTHG